jgi:arylsulfatase A-like enzyme
MLLAGSSDSTLAQVEEPPNVVVVMTDDQAAHDQRVLSQTNALIGDHGTTFSQAYATTPLCCPSRASFLTGQYAHNHSVLTNHSPDGGYARLDGSETLPVWLQRAGYRTGHIGRYLNGYGSARWTDGRRFPANPTEIPGGWSEWYGAPGGSAYRVYDYTLNENGTLVDYGSEPGDYQTDVYADKAVDFIERNAPGEPFFLSVAPLAPHDEILPEGQRPIRPAPRHQGRFADEPLRKSPSYNERDVSDKPEAIRRVPRFGSSVEQALRTRQQGRLESLLAVDDLVARVVSALEASGELENTLVIFTSDNGLLLGEHRVALKEWVYQESVRVPLLVRGPGFLPGTTDRLAANIDLAPTLLDLAGATPGHTLDGVSLLEPASGRALLLESYQKGQVPPYKAIHTSRYVFARHSTGERELYDLERDPFQLQSRHGSSGYAAIKRRLNERLNALVACAGETCQ